MVVTLDRPRIIWDRKENIPPSDPVYDETGDWSVQYKNEILVLVSAPLVDQRDCPLEDLNIQREIDAIVEALEDIEAPLSLKVTVKVASVETLLQIFSDRYKPLVIHFTGHGELWGNDVVLNLEDSEGKSYPYERKDLRRLFNTLDSPPCQLAVLNACYSERLANEFLNAGVPHVIAIKAEDKILSLATHAFAKQFYYALFNDQTIHQSFGMGCESIRSSRALRHRIDPETYERRNQTEAVKYHLLPRNNRVHDQRLPIELSTRGDISVREWENTNLPAVDRYFVGRRCELHHLVQILNEYQSVMIHGMGGMGKTAVAEALGRWYHERQYWKDGVWKIKLRDVQNLPTALSRIQDPLKLSSCESCQTLGQALRRKKCLLILDDVDQLRAEDPYGLTELIEALSGCERIGFVITGRQDLDTQSLSITQNYELSSLISSDSKTAFLNYAPSLIPESSAEAGNYQDILFSFLDGYPLPIKLAAAFMKESKTGQLKDVVDALDLNALQPLKPLRDQATRDNSLQMTLNLSFNVLPESAKQTFPLLGFFPGGISKELAQSGALGADAYSDLVTLLNYSMAELSPQALGWRVTLPEPARAYAEQKQTQSFEQIAPTVLDYFANFAEELSEKLAQDPDSGESLRKLQIEQGNLAHFLKWGYEHEESQESICHSARITTLLIGQWDLLMPERTAMDALQHSLSKASALEDYEAQGDVHRAMGNILLLQNGLEAAQAEYNQALALYEGQLSLTQNELEQAKYQVKRGDIYLYLQEYDSAVVVYESAYGIYQARQMSLLGAQIQVKWSEVYQYQEQIELALMHLEIAKELYESIDFKPGLRQVQSLINRLNGVSEPLPTDYQGFEQALENQVSIQMIEIPGGKFEMGSPEGVGYDNERPQHLVTIVPFYMSQTPITQAQWKAVMGNNPSKFPGNNYPVERVSWKDAQEFCQKLTEQSGQEYRLPSEAEWEYACRAGTQTAYSFGDEMNSEQANFGGSLGQISEVGQYSANPYGLYDMHGNVWEWCQDFWRYNYSGAPTDGFAWVTDGKAYRRILRGGSWRYAPGDCRSAYRFSLNSAVRNDNIGFRVSCSSPRSLL